MEILEVPVGQIKPAAYNPRKDLRPGDPAYDRLKKALTQFDLVEPLVWNRRSGNLVGGHQRFKILQERGDAVIPVSVVDLSERDEKALNLALNRHSGEWDFASLADLLGELDGGDLDMEITGFDAVELERLMTWTAPNAGLTGENAAPPLPADAITKRGDVWLLGKHRLMCGDSTVETDVEVLLAGVVPNLMVTDPPYGVEYDPEWRNRADRANGKPYGARAIGKVANDDQSDWREAWALFAGDVAYVWHAGRHAAAVQVSLESAGLEMRCQIIWAKQQFAISRGDYHWMHEPCWYAVRHGKKGHWSGDRKQTTLWQIDKPVKSETGHSAQKPVECMRRPMLNNSNPGQCVYDPFMGSGTTIIAAESTGRVALGLEIDPLYVDVAVKRWEDFTGRKAVLQ